MFQFQDIYHHNSYVGFIKNGYKLEPDVIVHTLTNKPQLYIPENIDLEKTSF